MVEAMQIHPQKNFAFDEYADAVARRDGAVGISSSKIKEVRCEMRRILQAHTGICNIDRALVRYVVGLGSEYREYLPAYLF